MSSYSEERETELLEHRSDLITAALFKEELNMTTPKRNIVAAKGRANGGRIKKDLLHQQGGRVQGRKQKTRRAKRHCIKQAAQVSNRMKNSVMTICRGRFQTLRKILLNATSIL